MITGMQSKKGLASRGYGAPSNPHRGKRMAAMQPVLEWGPNTLSINRAEENATVRRISPRYVQIEDLMMQATGLKSGAAYGYGGGFSGLGQTMTRPSGGATPAPSIDPFALITKALGVNVKPGAVGSDITKKPGYIPPGGSGPGASTMMTRPSSDGGASSALADMLPEGTPSWAIPVGVAAVAVGALWWFAR